MHCALSAPDARHSGDHVAGDAERPERGFALCDSCTAKPDLEERVRAYFRVKLGAQDAQWGTA